MYVLVSGVPCVLLVYEVALGATVYEGVVYEVALGATVYEGVVCEGVVYDPEV